MKEDRSRFFFDLLMLCLIVLALWAIFLRSSAPSPVNATLTIRFTPAEKPAHVINTGGL